MVRVCLFLIGAAVGIMIQSVWSDKSWNTKAKLKDVVALIMMFIGMALLIGGMYL